MAKQLNVNLAMTADTSKAKAELQALQRQLTELMTSAQKNSQMPLSKDIQKATTLAAQLKVQLESATSSTGNLNLTKFNNELRASKTTINDYKNALMALGPSGTQAFSNLATSIMKAEVPLKRSNTLLANFATTLRNTARWQISSSILHGFMGALQGAYGYAQDLNESLNNIRIVTGQSVDQMAKFADQANKAARALSTTTTAYTDAALIYYQQGLTGKDVTDRTNVTMKLANVSRQSAEDVSSQMTAIWNNFNDGSKSLEYYADVITKLGAATASSSDEIAQGLQKFASVADTVGLSYEKATAALATVVAETRQSADVVGTAFKTMFARFQGLSLGETLEDGVDLNKYSKALATIGVNILDANGELKVMDDILDETAEKWNQINEAQRVALAETVAGTRQYAQFMAIMNNYGKIQANQALAEGSEGTLQQQADIYAESWEAAGKRVKAAAQDIYNDLLDDKFFIKLLNGFEKVLSVVDNFIEGIGGVGPLLTLIGSIVTQVFGNQIANSIRNTINDLHSLTAKGRAEIQQLRQDANAGLLEIASKASGSNEGDAMKAAYSGQAELQDMAIEKAKTLGEQGQKQLQMILDINNALGQEVIALGKAADEEKRRTDQLIRQQNGSIQGKNKSQSYYLIQEQKQLRQAYTETEKAYSIYAEKIINMPMDIKGIQNNKEALQKMVQAFQAASVGTDEFQQELVELNNALINNQFDDAIAILDTLKIDIDGGLSPSIENLTNILRNMGVENAEAMAQRLATQFQREASAATDAVEGLNRHKNAVDGAKNSIAGLTTQIDLVSTGITALASALMSVNTAINAIRNIDSIISNDSLSAGEKAIQIMSALSMIIPVITTLTNQQTRAFAFNTLSKIANTTADMTGIVAKKAHAAATWLLKGATDALNTSMLASLGVIGLIVIAVGALIIGIIKLVGWLKKISVSNYDKTMKSIAEETEGLKEELDETQQTAKDLKYEFDSYGDIVHKLEECTKGTTEWKDALQDALDKTDEILQKYPQLLAMEGALNPDGTLNLSVFEGLLGQETTKAQALSYAQFGEAGHAAGTNKYHSKETTVSTYASNNTAYSKLASDYYGGLSGVAGTQLLTWEEIQDFLQAGKQITTEDLIKQIRSDEERASNDLFLDDPTIKASIEDLVSQINATTQGYVHMNDVVEQGQTRIDQAIQDTANNLAIKYAANNGITADSAQLFYGGQYGQEAFSKVYNGFREGYGHSTDSKNAEVVDLKKQYLSSVRGFSEDLVDQTNVAIKKEGNKFVYTFTDAAGNIIDTIDAETIKLAIAGQAAGEAVQEGFDFITRQLEGVGAGTSARNLANGLSESAMRNGGQANFSDVLGSLSADQLSKMTDTDSILEVLNISKTELSAIATLVGMTGNEFIAAITGARTALLDEFASLPQDIQNIFHSLPVDQLINLKELFKNNSEIKADFSEIINQIPEELQAEVAEAFSKVNFSDFDSIEQFKEYLQSLGMDFGVDLDQFAKKIEIAGQAIRNVNVDELAEKFGKVQKIINKVSTGGEISAKDYAKLSPSQQGYFRQKADDSYAMVGSAEELRNDATNERKTELSREIAYSDTNIQNTQTQLATATDTQEIDTLTSSLEQEQTKLEGLSFQYLSLAKNMQELGQRHSELTGLTNNSREAQQAYGEALTTLAAQYDNTKQEIEAYQAALRSNDEEAIKVAEHNLAVATSVAEDADAFSLEADELEVLADIFSQNTDLLGNLNAEEKDTARITADIAEAAADAATRYKRLNNGINDLADNYTDYETVIKRLNKAETAEAKATVASEKNYKTLRKTLADILDTNEELISIDFMSNIDSDILNDLAEGGTKAQEALDKLRDAFIDAQAEEYGLSEISEQLKSELANLADGAIIDIDNSPALQAMLEAWVQAGLTADEIQARLSGMHIDCDVTPFMGSMEDAANAAAAAGDAIIANASIDAETKTVTAESTDVNQDTAFDEKVTVVDKPGMFFSAETETGELNKQVTHFPEYHKTITPVTVTDEVTKQTTATGIKLSNAHKSGGGKVSSTSGRSGGGGGSKGGGGGGSKSKATQKQHTENRYANVQSSLGQLSREYSRASSEKDRLFGANRLNAIDKETAALNKIIGKTKDYINEIKKYKDIDYNNLMSGIAADKSRGIGAYYTTKDAAGNITGHYADILSVVEATTIQPLIDTETGLLLNYEELMQALEDYKNKQIEEYNKLDTAGQEAWDNAGKTELYNAQYEAIKDIIEQYKETSELWQDTNDDLAEKLRQLQDLNFEKWQTELDLKIDLNESQLKRLETAARVLGNSVYKTVEVMKNLFSADNKIDSQYSTFLNRGKEYEEAYKNAQALYDAGEISQDQFIQAVQTARDGIYEVIDSLLDMNEKMRQFYSDTIDGAVEELRKLTDQMAHHVEIMEHFKNLLSLTGKEFDYKSMETVLKATVEMERNALEESTAEYKMFQEQADNARRTYQELLNNPAVSEEAAREFKEAVLDPAIAQAREAENKMYEDAEAYLESVVELYKNTLDKIMAAREDALTKGLGWDFLADSMERAKAVQEEYLTKTNQIYETNTLLRKLSQDIDKTDSVAAKTKLKNFSTEIEQMQKQEKLNQSDLDIAKARYELLLAQIALEEAQNAKSIVRLQRDSEGNYGYVYTADQDKINDAEQNFADKQNDLYNLVLGQANDYGEKITQIEREKYEALQQLALDYQEGRITTQAEFDEKYLQTAAYYDDLLEAQRHSYYTALGWLDEVATTDHREAWTTAYKDVVDAGSDYRQDTIDTFTEIKDTMDQLDADRQVVTDNTSLGLQDLKKKTDELKLANQQLKTELITNTIPTMGNLLTSVADVTKEWALQYDQIIAMIQAYMRLAAAMDMAERDATTQYDFSNVSDFSQEMANEYAANGFSGRYNALARTRSSKGTTGYLSNDELSQMFQTAQQKGIDLSGKYFTRELYNEIVGMASGGYTGEWGSDGKLAILHEKELVLGAEDTANILATIELVRQISSAIDLRAAASSISTGLNSPSFGGVDQTLEQEVTIHAEFPNATDHTEIEEAFDNLINRATQYAARPSNITYKTPRI